MVSAVARFNCIYELKCPKDKCIRYQSMVFLQAIIQLFGTLGVCIIAVLSKFVIYFGD